MKLFKRIILILFIIFIVFFSILFLIGFSYYSNVLKEKPLFDRINEITSKENFTKFDDLNKNYINAVIAIEDHRYYDHGPVDFIAIARALFTNIKEGDFEEGGSTITQQVSKNVLFTQERTLSRKLGEVFGAYDLEKYYTKNEVFELYVNTMYFGDGYYNIADATKGYFDKDVKDMNLYECTLLAGIPNAPSVYSPTKNPELSKQRQSQVLNKMVKYKYLTKDVADKDLEDE